jgi:hypothetical protein
VKIPVRSFLSLTGIVAGGGFTTPKGRGYVPANRDG